jgi:hypothetical protein
MVSCAAPSWLLSEGLTGSRSNSMGITERDSVRASFRSLVPQGKEGVISKDIFSQTNAKVRVGPWPVRSGR